MELPVSSRARTLTPLMVMILHGLDSGLGDVKQQDITVQKLIIAARRKTEQLLISLFSFPDSLPWIRTPRRILLRELLLLLAQRIGAVF